MQLSLWRLTPQGDLRTAERHQRMVNDGAKLVFTFRGEGVDMGIRKLIKVGSSRFMPNRHITHYQRTPAFEVEAD